MSAITHICCPFSFINTCLFLVVSSRNYEVWGPGRSFKEIQQWRLPVFYLPVEHQGRWFGPQLASCRHRCDLWQRLEPPPGLCDSKELDIHVPSFQLSSDLSSLNPTWKRYYSIRDSACEYVLCIGYTCNSCGIQKYKRNFYSQSIFFI